MGEGEQGEQGARASMRHREQQPGGAWQVMSQSSSRRRLESAGGAYSARSASTALTSPSSPAAPPPPPPVPWPSPPSSP